MRVWLIATLLAAVALTGPAAALDPPTPADDVLAPSTHQRTGLIFPPAIAGVPLLRSIDYGRSASNPGLGYGYSYGVPGRLIVTAYVYDLGQRVPDGQRSAAVDAAFDESLRNVELVARRGGKYRDLRVIQPPAECSYGAVVFRCVTLAAISAEGTQPLHVRLLLTAYRNHFLKLRIDWRQNAPDDTAEAERVIQTFVGAVLR